MNRNDDGRKNMPKSRCPYCDSRVVDSRTPTLKNSLELTVTDSADYFIQCPKCRKIVGLIIKTMQPIVIRGEDRAKLRIQGVATGIIKKIEGV